MTNWSVLVKDGCFFPCDVNIDIPSFLCTVCCLCCVPFSEGFWEWQYFWIQQCYFYCCWNCCRGCGCSSFVLLCVLYCHLCLAPQQAQEETVSNMTCYTEQSWYVFSYLQWSDSALQTWNWWQPHTHKCPYILVYGNSAVVNIIERDRNTV